MSKISIIMPVFGLQKYVKLFSQSIKSIVDQTYTDWELIIACAGNNEKTKSIVKNEIEKYNDARIRSYVFVNGGAGPGVIRNYAFSKATGKYVTFHDSDDFSKPRRYEELVKTIRGGHDIVASNIMVNFIGQKNRVKEYSGENFKSYVNDRKIKLPINMCSAIMTAKFFNKMGGFEPHKFSSDSIFVIKVGYFRGVRELEPIPVLKEPLYVYNRQHHSVTTLQSNSYILKKCISAQRKPLKRDVRDKIISRIITKDLNDEELKKQLLIHNNLVGIENKLIDLYYSAKECTIIRRPKLHGY